MPTNEETLIALNEELGKIITQLTAFKRDVVDPHVTAQGRQEGQDQGTRYEYNENGAKYERVDVEA